MAHFMIPIRNSLEQLGSALIRRIARRVFTVGFENGSESRLGSPQTRTGRVTPPVVSGDVLPVPQLKAPSSERTSDK